MTHMYFSARAEGRISYGHLGRTDSCFILCFYVYIVCLPYILYLCFSCAPLCFICCPMA